MALVLSLISIKETKIEIEKLIKLDAKMNFAMPWY
jgi:hypothetical protein